MKAFIALPLAVLRVSIHFSSASEWAHEAAVCKPQRGFLWLPLSVLLEPAMENKSKSREDSEGLGDF